MLFEIFFWIKRRPGFEHYNIQAAFSEDLRCCAAGSARTDNANVINLRGANYLGH